MSVKQAYSDGAQAALGDYEVGHGTDAPDEGNTGPSKLRRAAPWLAGAGAAGLAGLAAYKHLRTPNFSSNPMLKKLQQKAVSGGFHRVVDVTPDAEAHWLHPQASPDGKMNWRNKLKMFMREGTNEAIPIMRNENDEVRVLGKNGPQPVMKTKGVTYGRNNQEGVADAIQGGTDLEGSTRTQELLTQLGRGGKRFEADFLNKHAPGAIPDTHTDMSQLFHGLPANRQEAVQELHNRIMTAHGKDFMMKPNQGLSSGGQFPLSGTNDWANHLTAHDTHMANPTNAAAYQAAVEGGGNAAAHYLKDNGLYEGMVLDNALKDPSSAILQKRLENPLGEWRVHTQGGEVPKDMTQQRFNPFHDGPKAALRGAPQHFKKQNLRDFVQNEVIKKLPPEYQAGSYGVDTMAYRKPDGSVGYKVLEMNPTERVTPEDAGGGSGFLDAPFSGHGHYRASTGRSTPLAAGVGGLLAGGGAGALTGYGVHRALNPSRSRQFQASSNDDETPAA